MSKLSGSAKTMLSTVAVAILLVTAYYFIPIRAGENLLPCGALTLVSLSCLAGLITYQVRNSPDKIGRLTTALIASVCGCALACYGLATEVPGEFQGIATRTDALYFTVVTMSTVGFGDVHPVGQSARALVTVMILFTLLFISLLARTIVASYQGQSPKQASPDEVKAE